MEVFLIAEVEFKELERHCFSIADNVKVEVGDSVVCQTEDSEELGKVLRIDLYGGPSAVIGKVLRKATSVDIAKYEENERREKEMFPRSKEIIDSFNLGMKLVDIGIALDKKRITFYFIADHRVDFRELVKALAAEYKTRIRMRQIGVRDYAKKVGGYGPCGQPLCCSTFLKTFQPVTIQMAREQHLSVNPQKLSGMCGRLMCCLSYEIAFYQEINKEFPHLGDSIKTEKGKAKVTAVNVFTKKIYVKYETGEEGPVTQEEYKKYNSGILPKIIPWLKKKLNDNDDNTEVEE